MPQIIIDDRDSSVVYGGNWKQVGTQPDYGISSSQPVDTNSSFEWSFNGSAVEVFGIDYSLSAPTKSSLSFRLDGNSPVNYTVPANLTHNVFHQSFFKAANLSDNVHILKMNVINLNDIEIYFDYILYTPNNNTLNNPKTIYFLDDRDPRLKYSEQWYFELSDQTFGGSLSRTGVTNSEVSLNFSGSAVALYGRLDQLSEMPIVSFTIDGGTTTAIQYSVPTSSPSYNNQFFVKNGLDINVNHEIILRTGNQAPLWLDSILVSPTGTLAESVKGIPNVSMSPSAASNPSSSNLSSSRSSTGPVVGGVVGGLAAITFATLAIIFFLRRRRKQRDLDAVVTPYSEQSTNFSSGNATGATTLSGHHTIQHNTSHIILQAERPPAYTDVNVDGFPTVENFPVNPSGHIESVKAL